jgi:TetR/AcrR family transcriptional regulator
MPKAAAVALDGDTERRILDAARTVFIRRGTAGARMQEIAEEAGVNQALLHYYFRTKERLAATVFRESAARLLPAVMGVFNSDAPLHAKVEQFVHVYIDTVRKSPFLPGYVVSEMHHHPERLKAMLDTAGVDPAPVVASLRKKLESELTALAKRGEIRSITPEQFLLNMIGLVVIPFVARPMLGFVLGLDDPQFARLLDERRKILPQMILNSLKP